jgi:dTDP-4-dehydrorhamnose reductase
MSINKKILMIGGSGYVGNEFARQFKRLGIETESISRSNGFDINNPNCFLTKFNKDEFDYSIFLSPVSGLNDPFNYNNISKFENNLIEIFSYISEISNSKIIYFSSNNVFSGLNGPYHVNRTPDGTSWFSYAKLYAETLCKKYFKRHLIVRTSLLLDASYSSAFLTWVRSSLHSKLSIEVRDNIIVSPTLVPTVVADSINILSTSNINLAHLSSGIQTSKFKIAHAIAKKFNYDKSLIILEKNNNNYLVNPGNYCLISNYSGQTEQSTKEILNLFGGSFD